MSAAIARLGGRAPLLANMVEGGKTPVLSAAELQAIGFRLAIFPGGTVRALSFSCATTCRALARTVPPRLTWTRCCPSRRSTMSSARQGCWRWASSTNEGRRGPAG